MPHDGHMTLTDCLATVTLAGINTAVFIATAAGADPASLALHPSASAIQWFTYMFCHAEIIHFIVNLAVIVAAGIWLERTAGHAVTLATYIAGGLSGALLFTLACRTLGVADTTLTGASAAALGLAAAALVSTPGICGRLRQTPAASAGIVLVAVIILWGLTGNNAGGALAHIGGIAVGIVIALATTLIRHSATDDNARHTDLITKARISGYSSLSDDERSRLASDSDSTSNGKA